MTPAELEAAARTLYERGATEGTGAFKALYERLDVPKPTFAKWRNGRVPVPRPVARFIEDLLRWSEAATDETLPARTRQVILELCRAPKE